MANLGTCPVLPSQFDQRNTDERPQNKKLEIKQLALEVPRQKCGCIVLTVACLPTASFLSEVGVKMTIEPPKGLKMALLRAYMA
eukprot:4759443-Amphidinium_carterae.1